VTGKRVGDVVAGALGLVWVVCLVRILRHRIFVSLDSLISYAHVWYVSDRLWHHGRIPLAMPVLGHGQAFAFPYGFLPWFTAAIFRPLLGDRVVTLWLVAGMVLLIATIFLAFPELRRSWWAAAVLASPALPAAALIGQFPFVWASVFLFAGIACWRHDRRNWATAFMAAAQATHPAVMCPIVLVVVGWRVLFHRERDALPRYAISVVVALPAVALVVLSPVFGDSSTWDKTWGFLDTVFPRSLVLAVPLALAWLWRRWPGALAGAAAFVAVLAIDVAVWFPLSMPVAWRAMDRQPSQAMQPFLHSAAFHPGWTYRLLRVDDKRVGLYQLIRAGGRSDAEFFPESELRRSWPSLAEYSTVLRARHVDAVMLWRSYEQRIHSDERRLLDELSAPTCAAPLACTTLVATTSNYRLYELRTRPPR